MRRPLYLMLVLLACAGCAGTGTMRSSAPPPDPHTQMAALENRIFELIQDERHKIDPGAKTLQLDSELAGVARQRASDMAAKNYFANKSPEGASSASIIMDQDASFQGLLGENIAAQHYVTQSGVEVEAFAHRFVDSWLASKSHRENLAYAVYDRTGVGAAVNGDTVYVSELFATDLGLPPPDQQHPQSRRITEYPDAKTGGASPAASPDPDAARGLLAPKPRPDR